MNGKSMLPVKLGPFLSLPKGRGLLAPNRWGVWEILWRNADRFWHRVYQAQMSPATTDSRLLAASLVNFLSAAAL